MQCQQSQQSRDPFSQEMDFIESQQKVVVERLESLLQKVQGRPQTEKRLRQWIEDARFLLSDLRGPESPSNL